MSNNARKMSPWRLPLIVFLSQHMALYPLAAYAQSGQIVTDGRTATQLSIRGNTTDVTTNTIRGINAYNSFSQFDVYQGNVVNLHVPGAATNLLNLVHDKGTQIDGILNAYKNGRIGGNVFFANPHGFVVGSQGVVNVGSLTAVTPTKAFMDRFFDNAGNPSLTATQQLIDGTVPINGSGLISVQGKLNAEGDILLQGGEVIVSGSLKLTPNGVLPKPDAEAILNTADTEHAVGVVERNGEIVILGAGDVAIRGALIADGSEGVDAGRIEVRAGQDITLSGEAALSAKGQGDDSSGGAVTVFADRNALIKDQARLDASAGQSGDGGFVEFSAKKTVELAGGSLLATAENGTAGTVLVDPENLVVSSHLLRGASANGDGINWNAGNLILDADEKITVSSNVVVSTRQVGTPGNVADHLSGLSTGDSGDMTLQAKQIELQSGSKLLAHATLGHAAGTVTLDADASAGILGGGIASSIAINGAEIRAGSVSITAKSAGDDSLGIAAIGTTRATIAIDNSAVITSTAGDVLISAASEVKAKAEGTPADLLVDAAIVDVDSIATVQVNQAQITAAGKLDITADSTVNSQAIAKASSTKGNVNADAAFATSVVDSTSKVIVGDGTTLSSTGNTTLASNNNLDITTKADGTAGGSTAAGATVAVAVINSTTETTVSDTVEITTASDLAVNAISVEKLDTQVKSTAGGSKENSTKTKNELNKEGRKAETSEGGVSVAAALAVSALTSTTTSTLNTQAGKTISADEITLTADGSRNVTTKADASATGGGVGVGVAVAINVAKAQTSAVVKGSPLLATNKLKVQSLTGSAPSSFSTSSNSGAGASNVGVAGSLATSVVTNTNEALIEGSSAVTLSGAGGDVELVADNGLKNSVTAKASQTGDGKVGVGASIAVNVGVNTSKAELADNATLSGAKDLTLTANSDHTASTEAKAGAAGGVAVTPVGALTVAVNNTQTRLGSGNKLTQSGAFSASAKHKGSVTTKTDAEAAGDKVAVGASLAVTSSTDLVSAITDRDMDANGSISFLADSKVASVTEAKASAKGGKPAESDGSNSSGDKDVNAKVDDQVKLGDKKSGKTTKKEDVPDASTSEGGVSVAAAIGVNIGVSKTTAVVPADRDIKAGGQLSVQSINETDASAKADGSQVNSGSTDVGVGAAVALNSGIVTNSASIGERTRVNVNGVKVTALMPTDAKHDFVADANSGAGASKVGLAGSLAVHVGVTNSEALIADSAQVTITNDKDVTLSVVNNSDSKVVAKATQSGNGKVGVGASVAVNTGVNTTKAKIANNAVLSGGGKLALSADAEHDMSTTAEAGSAGGVAVTPVAAVAVGINRTTARVGTGSSLDLAGDLSITATQKGSVTTKAKGLAKGDAAVGVAIAVAVPLNSVTASLDRGGEIDGDLTLSATTELTVETDAEASAKGASDDKKKNGGSSNELVAKNKGSAIPAGETTPDAPKAEVDDPDSNNKTEVQVAGAIGVNVISNDAAASIGDGVVITKVGDTKITATNDVNHRTFATGEAVSDDVGVGAAVALTLLDNDTKSSIGTNTRIASAGDIAIKSKTTHNMGARFVGKVGTEAKAGASGGKVAVAGALALVNTSNSSEAAIEEDVEITQSGDVTVQAEDQSKVSARAWAGALSKGKESKAGVGAAFAIVHTKDDTKAFVGDRAKLLDAQSLLVTAENKKVDITDFRFDFYIAKREFKNFSFDDLNPLNVLSSNNYYTEAAAGAASTSDSGVAIAGAFSVQVLESTTEAYVGDSAVVTTAGKTAVSAKRDTNAVALGGSFGGSKKVGVGVTATNITTLDKTLAHIGKSAQVTTTVDNAASSVTVNAETDQILGTIAISGAVAAGGEGAAINGVLGAVVSNKTTDAYIDEQAVVKAKGSVTVGADSDTDTFMLSGGFSGAGKVAVGGSLAANVMTDKSYAHINNGATVAAKRDTAVDAKSDELAVAAVISGGAGGKVGVVGSVAVNTLLTDTQAYIGKQAQINTDAAYDHADQRVLVNAADNSVIVDIAGAGAGGGDAGVGFSIDTIVMKKNTKAYIDSAAQVEAEKDIEITADADEVAVSLTAGFAGGGKVGVGGAVSVVVSINDTKAYIANDLAGVPTVVDAKGHVKVTATDDLVTALLAGSGAGGGNAGVGASLAVSTILNTTQAEIGDKAQVSADTDVEVKADATETLVSTVVGGAGGGTAGVAATVAASVIKTTTKAVVGKSATVNADRDVLITANDDTHLIGTAGAGAGGGSAGVGAAADTGIMLKQTSAYVDSGAAVDAGRDIKLTATAKELHVSTAIGLAGGGSAGVGGAVSTSVMANKTEAYTVGNAKLSADEDIAINATDNATTVTTAGAGAGGGAAGVGGSLAVAVNSNTTRAFTGSGSILDANKQIDIKAASSENVITTVVGGAGGGSAGVAGAVGVKVVNSTTEAFLGTGSKVNQSAGYGGADQSLNVEASDQVVTVGIAGAGAGGGAAGVGVGADVTIVRNKTSAYIGDGSLVDVDKDVSVAAKSDKYVNTFSAAGAGGGAAGVAGAASVIVVGSLLDGQAKSGLSGDDDQGNSGSTQGFADEQISKSSVGDMLGDSDQSKETKTLLDNETSQLSVSDDFDKTSSVALNNTKAFIGPNAQVNVGNDLSVTADDRTLAILATGAGSGGGAAGVAGAIGVVLIHDSAEAFIAHDAVINAEGDTLVKAGTKDDVFGASITGSGAGAAAVNGSAKVTVVKADTAAYVADDAKVNQSLPGADSVTIKAESATNIVSLGGSGGGAGAAAVGGVADVAVVTKNTQAFVGKRAKLHAEQNIVVEAVSSELLVSGAIAIFGAGAAAVSGVASTRVISNTTEAYIDEQAEVDSDGNVKLSAVDDALVIAIAGTGSGAGAAGVTGAVNVNTITNKTRAYVANSATVNADGTGSAIDVYTGTLGSTATPLATGAWDDGRMVDVDGDGTADVAAVDKKPDMNKDGTPDGDISNGASFSVKSEGDSPANDADDTAVALGEGMGAKQKTAVTGLSVNALSNEKVVSVIASVAGAGAAAVSGTAMVNVIATETTATIGNNAVINQSKGGAGQSVNLNATDNTLLIQTGGTIAGAGAAGVSGSANTAIVTKSTRAEVGNDTRINAGGSVGINAQSVEDLYLTTANASFAGGAGVGGAVGVAVVSNETRAKLGLRSQVDSAGDLRIAANSDSFINVNTVSGAAGAVGVSGAFSVAVMTNDTEASVGEDAELDVSGQTKVAAEADANIITATASAAGGGLAGVAGAVSVKVVSGTTAATMGNRVKVNQGAAADDADQRIDVIAKDNVELDGVGGSGAVSGTAGVGATADINIVRNTTTASIGSQSKLKAAQDINISAVADKDVDSITVAAAGGGAVGIGGATSIIVIGAALDSDSQESLRDSDNPNNNTASYVDGKITDDQASGDMGDSEHIQSTRSDVAARTASLNVSSSMNANQASVNDKTLAYLGTQSQADAGRNLDVVATDYTKTMIKTGGTGVGAVGVGGSVGVASIDNNTEATIADGTRLSALGTLSVAAKNTQHVGEKSSVLAFGGAAGLVGIGAAVAYIDVDNSVIARIGTSADPLGVEITQAGTVSITASQDDDIETEAIGAAAGAGAVGASLSRASRTGNVSASMGRNAKVGNLATPAAEVGAVSLAASSAGSVKAKTKAGAAGTAFSGSGALADADDYSTVTAHTGVNNQLDVGGQLGVTASTKPKVTAESVGVSVAGGVKIGVSVARADAVSRTNAYIGSGNQVKANSLLVRGQQLLPSSGHSVSADAFGSGGGLLLGVNATESKAENWVQLASYVNNNSTLTIGNATTIEALNNTQQHAKVDGDNAGILAAGFNKAHAKSTSDSDAYVGSGVQITGGDLIVNAQSSDDNFADAVSGSGGVISGAAANARTTTISNTHASIGQGVLNRAIKIGALDMHAKHTTRFDGKVDSTNASLVGASGAYATNDVVSNVAANLSGALDIEADEIEIDALNQTYKSSASAGYWNVNSGSGGLFDLPAARSLSTIMQGTQVNVGASSVIAQTGSRKTPGNFELNARNDVTAYDKVRMNAGGAVAVAKGESLVKADTNNANVTIGSGAALLGQGDVKLGTRSVGNVSAQVAVDVYGLAGAPSGLSLARFMGNNQVNIGDSARVLAMQDVKLAAGVDTQNRANNITTRAQTDLWNNTAIPINSKPGADAVIDTRNSIVIDNNADVAAVRHAILSAKQGDTDASGVGIGKDIYRELLAAAASAISNAFGGGDVSFDIHGGSQTDSSLSTVAINGTGKVRVGIHAKQELEIGIDGTATKRINGVVTTDPEEGISIVDTDRIDIAQDILNRIASLKDLIREYTVDDTNSDAMIAVAAYESEIRFLERKLVDLGYPENPNEPGFSDLANVSPLKAAEDARDGMTGRKTTYDNERTPLVTDNTTRTNQNSTLTSNNNTLSSQNTTLQGQVVTLRAQQAALDPNSSTYTTDYNNLQSQINARNGQISSNNSTIASNNSTITSNNGIIATNTTRINELTGFINQLDTQIANVNADINSGTLSSTAIGGPVATFYTIGDVVAQLGNIYVDADLLTGTGTLNAPGDAEIRITNHSPTFLKLQDLIIPANDGGKLYFNGVDINSNAAIDVINDLPAPAAGFNLQTAESSGSNQPQIIITSNYDPLDSFYTSQTPADIPALAPDIIVKAGTPDDMTTISNQRGLVKIDSAAGSIRLEENTIITGDRVEIKTRNGDFVESYTNTFKHKGGNPLTFVPGDENLGTLPRIDRSPEQAGSGVIANGSVLIAARYLNINGVIQSGIPEWGVKIPANAIVDIPTGNGSFTDAKNHYDGLSSTDKAKLGAEYYQVSGATISGLAGNVQGDWEQIKVNYNAKEDRLELAGVQVQGGYIELFGQIFNTNQNTAQNNSGRLRVLDGYGQIKVDNLSNLGLMLNVLDAGRGVKGEINITNIVGQNANGSPIIMTTQYIRDSGGSRSDSYDPTSGLRYIMAKGTDTSTEELFRYSQSKWFNSDVLASTAVQDKYLVTSRELTDDPLSKGEVLRVWTMDGTTDISNDHYYDRSETKVTSSNVVKGDSWKDCNWWTICANATHYQEYWRYQGTKTIDTYSVKADYPISIDYIGFDQATIDVKSKGNILINGGINNRSGDTTITSTAGSILQLSDVPSISGTNIDLTAANDIGSRGSLVQTSGLVGGKLNATAVNGDIHISHLAGDMTVGLISAQNGLAELKADRNLVGVDTNARAKANRIELTSTNGAIGTAGQAFLIETGVTIDPLLLADFGLKALSRDDMNIKNQGGDLMLVAAESLAGDVRIETDGAIVDNNLVERTDVRTETELANLWDDMRLRGTLAQDKADDEVKQFESSISQDYKRYWNVRKQQSDPASYDATYEVQLTSVQEQLMRDQLASQGYSSSEINKEVADYAKNRTDEYHQLHAKLYDPSSDNAVKGSVVTNYVEGFKYTAHADEIAERTKGSSWDQFQLELSVAPGLLKEITDTVTVIKEPNAKGRNVTLIAGTGIGVTEANRVIDLNQGLGAMTRADKAAIAAAERPDTAVAGSLLTITQRKPVNIEHSSMGKLNAYANNGYAYLGSEGDIIIDQVRATKDIRIKVAGGLSNGNTRSGVAAVNIVGDDLILEAANDGIGSATAPVLLDLFSDSTLTVRASGDIYLTENLGDMNLDTLYSRQAIQLLSQGAILDAYNTTDMNVRAESLRFIAGGSIGESGNALDVLNDLEGVIVANSGLGEGIFFNVPSGVGSFGAVASGDAVSLTAANGYTLKGAVTGLADINLIAGDRIDISATGSVAGLIGDFYLLTTTLQMVDDAKIDAGTGRIDIETVADAIITGVGTDNATLDAIKIKSGGRLLDGGDSRVDITAIQPGAGLSLDITGGIGNATVTADGIVDQPNSLEINVNRVTKVISDNDINLTATEGLVADQVESRNGSVNLRALNGDAELGQVKAAEGVDITAQGDKLTADRIEGKRVNLAATNNGSTLSVTDLFVAERLGVMADFIKLQNVVHTTTANALRIAVSGNDGGMAETLSMMVNSSVQVLYDIFKVNTFDLVFSHDSVAFTAMQVGNKGTITTPLHSVVIDNGAPAIYPASTLQIAEKSPFDLRLIPERQVYTNAKVVYYNPNYLVNGFSTENSLTRLDAKRDVIPEGTSSTFQQGQVPLLALVQADSMTDALLTAGITLISFNGGVPMNEEDEEEVESEEDLIILQ